MEEVRVIKPIKKVGGTVSLPGSKSISNRALLLAALSRGTTHLKNLLVAEDTDMMIGALKELGASLSNTAMKSSFKAAREIFLLKGPICS